MEMSPEQLNSFGDSVDKFCLLSIVFVEEQVQLVKGRAGSLPMRLLVEVAEGHRIGEKLVELFRHFQADGLFKLQWQHMTYRAVSLHFRGFLVETRLSVEARCG